MIIRSVPILRNLTYWVEFVYTIYVQFNTYSSIAIQAI